jgi:predicted nucleic acid-binding protein
MSFIIDTSAWVEYLEGSNKGDKINHYVENEEIITPLIVVLELSVKAEKEGWNMEKIYNFIKLKSSIVGFPENEINLFGKIYVSARNKIPSFGMADAIILATSKNLKSKIITTDHHFKEFEDIILIE